MHQNRAEPPKGTGGDRNPSARRLGAPVTVATGVLVGATVAGQLGRWWWPFALLEHARLQLVAGLGVGAAALWLLGRTRTSVVAVAAIALNLAVLAPYGPRPGGAEEPELTILHLNTDRGRAAALDYLDGAGGAEVDVVLLQEVTPTVADSLDDLVNHRLVLAHPRDNTHGSAILLNRAWSGEVLESDVVNIPASSDRPLLRAVLSIEGQPVTVLSYHAIRPGGRARTEAHDRELAALADWVADEPGEVIVIGDANATPWSRPVRRLEEAGLVAASRGSGLRGTWPASWPGVLRIPIDLCLHTPGWETVSRTVGPPIGGDHRPLHVGLRRR